MDTTLFLKYSAAIRRSGNEVFRQDLLMESDGKVSVFYAPFDAVNTEAHIAIVGITPGKTQMRYALAEARRQLALGASATTALVAAKATAGFSGAMRPNLVALMDCVGLNGALSLNSCEELFGSARHLLQTCSVLTFPVFVGTDDYRGTPDPLSYPLLQMQVVRHFEPLAKTLRKAFFLPLGPVPTKVLLSLCSKGLIARNRILDGLPHPSGANGERIRYFLGQKPRSLLSPKTDPDKLDAARTALERRILDHAR